MDGVGNLMIQLSKRLQTVADYIIEGHRLADIGSDHALLPVYAVQSGKTPQAIAGELNQGPWQAACQGVANANLTAQIDVRRGNGLQVLQPREADTVTICGMGGALIRTILETGSAEGKLEGVKQLILQPNVGEDTVRVWLLENDWMLKDESILEEDGKIYEVLHAVKGDEAKSYNERLYEGKELLPYPAEINRAILLRMGPHLLRKKDEVLKEKWHSELEKLQYIIDSLSQSQLDSAKSKLAAIKQDHKLITEVLQWLFTVKH